MFYHTITRVLPYATSEVTIYYDYCDPLSILLIHWIIFWIKDCEEGGYHVVGIIIVVIVIIIII